MTLATTASCSQPKLIALCFLWLMLTIPVDAQSTDSSKIGIKCIEDSQCSPPYLLCQDNVCSRKPLFPMTGMEIGAVFVMLVLVMFAIICSLSGGLIVVPICILMMGFSAKQAVTLANCIVLLTSLTKYIMGIFKTNPNVAFKTIVDYNAAIIMIPTITLFSTIGGIAGFFFPEVMVLFLLISMLVLSMISAIFQIKRQIAIKRHAKYQPQDETKPTDKEKDKKGLDQKNQTEISPLSQTSPNEHNVPALLVKPEVDTHQSPEDQKRLKADLPAQNNPHEKAISHQKKVEGSNFYLPKFMLIVVVLVVSILAGIFRGGSGLKSVIGVVKCSKADWSILGAYCVALGLLPLYSYIVVFKEQRLKKQIGWTLDPHEVVFTKKTFAFTILWSSFTGFMSTVTGLGGGVILTPFFGWLHFMPVTASWTINIMVLLSKIAAIIIAVLSGQMIYSYVFFYGGLIALAIIIAENSLLILIRRMKTQIVIPVLILGTLVISFGANLYIGISKWIEQEQAGRSAWEFSSYC